MKDMLNAILIQEYIMRNKLSKAKFCRQCKIAISTYDKIMNNNYKGNILALCKIAQKMKVHLTDMFI